MVFFSFSYKIIRIVSDVFDSNCFELYPNCSNCFKLFYFDKVLLSTGFRIKSLSIKCQRKACSLLNYKQIVRILLFNSLYISHIRLFWENSFLNNLINSLVKYNEMQGLIHPSIFRNSFFMENFLNRLKFGTLIYSKYGPIFLCVFLIFFYACYFIFRGS